jgi:hypothetical protein
VSSILTKSDYVKGKLQAALGDSGIAVYEHGFNVTNDAVSSCASTTSWDATDLRGPTPARFC